MVIVSIFCWRSRRCLISNMTVLGSGWFSTEGRCDGGSRCLTGGVSVGGNGPLVAQHPTDHVAICGIEAVVTHGAPCPAVPHLHTPSSPPRHKTHFHCGDTKLQT